MKMNEGEAKRLRKFFERRLNGKMDLFDFAGELDSSLDYFEAKKEMIKKAREKGLWTETEITYTRGKEHKAEFLKEQNERYEMEMKAEFERRIEEIKSNPVLGSKSFEHAYRHMPVLTRLLFELKDDNVFAGKRIGMCMHVTKETAVLAKGLHDELGAEVYLCGSNPLSTQDDIVAYLKSGGMEVYAKRGESIEEYEEGIRKVLRKRPDIIIDDGADMHVMYHTDTEFSGYTNVCGGTEETTTGITRLNSLKREGLRYPIVKVNDTPTKNMFDNRYGTGQSSWEGVLGSANILVAGKTVVVAGYGWVGKGVAKRAQGLGAKVIVTETYDTKQGKINAIDAFLDGYRVMKMEDAIKEADIVLTATGNKDVVRPEHMFEAKDGCVLANVGHFDVEIDVKWLNENAERTKDVRTNMDMYRLSNGKEIYLIAEGRLANLVAAEGHPPEVMQMSLSDQLLSVDYLLRNNGRLRKTLYKVSKSIDDKVAMTTLDSYGIKIDKLTKEQTKYLKSWRI